MRCFIVKHYIYLTILEEMYLNKMREYAVSVLESLHQFFEDGITTNSQVESWLDRTIADLSGEEQVQMAAMAEAIQFRMMDAKYWGSHV